MPASVKNGRYYLFLLFILVSPALLLSSCGKKASPVPPGTLRPRAIDDLAFSITPDGAILTWTIPEKNMDGSPILTIEGFSLFRAESPMDSFCRGCPPNFRGAIEIPFSIDPDNAGRMSYEDRTLQTGIIYTYEVRTKKGILNISDPSNRISFAWHSPPGPPEEVKTVSVPDGVKISWKPPLRWTDGTPLNEDLSYVVKRKEEKGSTWYVIADKVKGTSFYDTEIDPSTRYRYMIKAVYNYAGTDIPGMDGAESDTAGILDTTAPSAPENVAAIVEAGTVIIRWDANVEPDVFGYYIYRKSPGGIVLRLNSRPVILNRFIDRTALMPGTYKYSVSAVDNSVNNNESVKSAWVPVKIKGF